MASMTDLNINMAAQMSNDELREAIKYAHETANSMGTANPLYQPWYRHLDALLEIQRGRAADCCLDNSNTNGQPRLAQEESRDRLNSDLF